jgi:oligosaccharide repeat unit polymerase
MSSARKVVGNFALSAWVIWAVTAVCMLVAYRASTAFVLLYLCYLVLGGIALTINRDDILAPPGLFTVAGFLAFGLTLVLIFTGRRTFETGDITMLVISDDALMRALILLLVAKAAFILGYYSALYRYIPLKWVGGVAANSRKVSIASYLLLAGIVIIAGLIRIRLHLGEAGGQTTIAYVATRSVIPYVGILNYALFDGVLVACAWFLAQGLRQDRQYVVLGLSLLIMIAITQALLGWKGGIIEVIYVGFGLFWYQQQQRGARRPYSFGWLLALLLSASTLIQFGYGNRVARVGGTTQFATSFTDLIQKIAFRSQGTTRLAAVTDYFGPLTWFNDFFIKNLAQQNLTVGEYMDRKLYAVEIGQLHSVGPSGPGGPYVALGIFGVAGAYLLLGILYRRVYSGMMTNNKEANNILYVVLYAYLMFALANLLSENFGFAFLKNMVMVLSVILLLRFLIGRGRPASRE